MTPLTYDLLVITYERGGAPAVEELCSPHNLPRAHCVACETDTPTFDDACACCGSVRE